MFVRFADRRWLVPLAWLIAVVATIGGFALVGIGPSALVVASLGAMSVRLLVVRFAAPRAPATVPPAPTPPFAWPEGRAAHDILRDWWRGHDGPRDVPVPEGDVAAFEARHGLTLPADFRAYLLQAAPASEEMDAEYTTWWPFERLRTLPEECPDSAPAPLLLGHDAQCVVFADHLIWCWAWAICCAEGENHGKVMLVSGDDRFVADSFTDFVRRHLTDWRSLC